jgi:hypothetical protein
MVAVRTMLMSSTTRTAVAVAGLVLCAALTTMGPSKFEPPLKLPLPACVDDDDDE